MEFFFLPQIIVSQRDPEQHGLFCKPRLVVMACFKVVLAAHGNPVPVGLCPSAGELLLGLGATACAGLGEGPGCCVNEVC